MMCSKLGNMNPFLTYKKVVTVTTNDCSVPVLHIPVLHQIGSSPYSQALPKIVVTLTTYGCSLSKDILTSFLSTSRRNYIILSSSFPVIFQSLYF